MANHKSALKRARQSETKRIRNRAVKTRIKNVIKQVRLAVNNNATETALSNLDTAKSVIGKAAQNGVIHKRNAARKISRISKLVNSISV